MTGLRQKGPGVAHGGRGEDMNGESINRGRNGARVQRKREQQLASEDDVKAHPLHSIPRRPDHCCETARQPVPPGDHPGAEKVLTDSRIRAGLKPVVLFQTVVYNYTVGSECSNCSEERNAYSYHKPIR